MPLNFNHPLIKRVFKTTGALSQSWTAPTTYRRWAAGVRKILRCYRIFSENKIFWPDLLDSFLEVSKNWEKIGGAIYRNPTKKNNDLYFDVLSEVNAWDISGLKTGQVAIEEVRERVEGNRCSMCRVELVWPAYVVQRKAESTEVIHKSSPLGIMCLHSYKGKLQKLLTDNDFKNLLSMVKTTAAAAVEESAEALASI